MEYYEAANFLFGLRRYPSRTGVTPTRRLLEHLGSPGDDIRIVQVGGSNGKGSTARMVESVLREAGYDVGLYTSPHLDDLRERVRINGRPVTKAAVSEFVAELEPYVRAETIDGAPPTFFEAVTALAVRTFDRENVEVAVVEVGIGGEHDATSALSPEVAAVTNVTLEHADLLGDTIEEIARDKAAIAPDDAPLVTAATGAALDVVRTTAGETLRVGGPDDDADVTVVDRGRTGVEQGVEIDGSGWRVETALPLLGSHQCENAGIAAALCRLIGGVTPDDIGRGLRNAHWPGRFEVMDRNPLVVLDGAHNPGSCAGIAETLSTFEYDELHLVFGAMGDKDVPEMVAALPAADAVYACRPDFDRAEAPESVAAVVEGDGRAGAIDRFDTVSAALDDALDAAEPDDAILVCGSLFVVAEARRRWSHPFVTGQISDGETAAELLGRADVSAEAVDRHSADGVHRVVTARVRPAQADRIERELLSVGGECAVSAVDAPSHDLVDAVLLGTRSQFDRALERLHDGGSDLAAVAAALERELDRDDGASETPWGDDTAVMGILNVTPDSFYDGGRYETVDDAIDRAERLIDAGAEIVDIGGESTRPGAETVPIDEEIERVVPVVEALAETDVAVSVDTRKAAVARAALDAGADILNDVSGLEDPEMRLVAAEYNVPVVVMHSIHTPVDPEANVAYDDVVTDTIDALAERVLLAEKAGLDRSQIIVDPGLGFGKSTTENFELLGRLDEFRSLGCPVLVGHSRKSMFRAVDRGTAEERLAATVAASALAAERGADIIRVHDVAENVAAVKTAAAAADPDRFDDR
jgi:dihydropteroate synthase